MSHSLVQVDPPAAFERLNAATAWLIDMRSFQAMRYLVHHGYSRVTNLAGGIGMWHAHDLPVTQG